ncbi:hypothetical protein JHK82_011564 [Glycine max]|uniref:Uncharacterized protein n=1 Tax=Glycine max TaxID=3847 RepID=K7KMF4_SOYBN|nr:hypothetical protein JHK85_011886 [Glycine max]KAG5153595.1 hypothetical protein JHK82_011564 [Glycine max]KAH1132407.1 hypothetical protein GYH30_011327 [Glycine max]KRH56824.1 hypothetical protein GLYMA_05G021600v4 [Glycine max]
MWRFGLKLVNSICRCLMPIKSLQNLQLIYYQYSFSILNYIFFKLIITPA